MHGGHAAVKTPVHPRFIHVVKRLSSPLLHLLHKHNIYWALRWEVWGLLWTMQGARKVRFAMPDWAWWKVKVVSQQTMDLDGLPRRCQTPQARAWRLDGSHGTRLGLFNGFRGCFKGTLDRSTVGWLEEADHAKGQQTSSVESSQDGSQGNFSDNFRWRPWCLSEFTAPTPCHGVQGILIYCTLL